MIIPPNSLQCGAFEVLSLRSLFARFLSGSLAKPLLHRPAANNSNHNITTTTTTTPTSITTTITTTTTTTFTTTIITTTTTNSNNNETNTNEGRRPAANAPAANQQRLWKLDSLLLFLGFWFCLSVVFQRSCSFDSLDNFILLFLNTGNSIFVLSDRSIESFEAQLVQGVSGKYRARQRTRSSRWARLAFLMQHMRSMLALRVLTTRLLLRMFQLGGLCQRTQDADSPAQKTTCDSCGHTSNRYDQTQARYARMCILHVLHHERVS